MRQYGGFLCLTQDHAMITREYTLSFGNLHLNKGPEAFASGNPIVILDLMTETDPRSQTPPQDQVIMAKWSKRRENGR